MGEQWPTESSGTQGNVMSSLKASSHAYDDWISTLNASDSIDGHQESASNVPDISVEGESQMADTKREKITMTDVPESVHSAEGAAGYNTSKEDHTSSGKFPIHMELPSVQPPADVLPELDNLKQKENGLTGSQNESLESRQYNTQVFQGVRSSQINVVPPITLANNGELMGLAETCNLVPQPVLTSAESKDAATDFSILAESSNSHLSSHSKTNSPPPVVRSGQDRDEPERLISSSAHDYQSADSSGVSNFKMAVDPAPAFLENVEVSAPGLATVMKTQQVQHLSKEVLPGNTFNVNFPHVLVEPTSESMAATGEVGEESVETLLNQLSKTSSEANAEVVPSRVDVPQETGGKRSALPDPQAQEQGNVFTASAETESWISVESAAQPTYSSTLSDPASVEPTNVVEEISGMQSPEGNMESLWTEALGASQGGFGASWDTVFEDMFEEDGFLEDETADRANLPQTTIIPNTSTRPVVTNAQKPTAIASTYGVAHPVRPTIPTHSTSIAAPTQFFEELPSVQTARRKPKQQVVSYSQPSIPAPASQSRPMAPPRQSSAQYSQLRMPERLETFPPQAATPLLSFSQSTTSRHTNPLQPIPPINPRYSPTPSQPSAPATRPANVAQLANSRYFSAPLPLPTLGTEPGHQIPPSKSSYVPAASSFIPRPASSGNPQTISYLPSQYNTSIVAPPNAYSIQDYAKEATDLSRPLPPPPVNRFAPRTSSPLAQPDQRPQYDRSITAPMSRHAMNIAPDHATPYHEIRPPIEAAFGTHGLQDVEVRSDDFGLPVLGTRSSRGPATSGLPHAEALPHRYSPSLPSNAPSLASSYPPSRQLSYVPQDEPRLPALDTFDAPRRPRTQSPETTKSLPPLSTGPIARPASAHVPSSPPIVPIVQRRLPFGSQQQQLQPNELDFAVPITELASDQLQRWKGCPVFHWNASGTISSTFPQRVPRYGVGQVAPVFRSVPGEVKLRKVRDVLPADDVLSSFPGPLKSKNKKKEVVAWLTLQITRLEQESKELQFKSVEPKDLPTRLGEKILLWQTIRLMVEHDGLLSGNSSVDLAIRQVFSAPTSHDITSPAYVTNTLNDMKATSTHVLNDIKRHLFNGERDKAVWHAVDNNLWAHAMLISSTLGNGVWKQVVQEFVRKEVRNVRRNNGSLAALYEVFGGNWDESVDELVPSSARAGFQMMSTTEVPGQSQNILDGINQWQETLALVLSNRSSGDESALLALGKLLAGYGRIEAAHVCFLFSRSVAHFGGSDDARSSFTLVGADLTNLGTEPTYDLDAILLSEVYEFASSLLTPASAMYMPHLQAFKLYHAYALADSGHRDDAMRYCEAIAAAIKSNTRASHYYHNTLLSQLDDLAKRLSQSPSDAQSSWLSKPSIGKVSGSVWARFNSFVAGDENSGPSNSPGDHSDHEAGPFGRMTGGTPTISRTNSVLDLHSTEFQGVPSSTVGSSRYAPVSFTSEPSQEFDRSSLHPSAQPSYHPPDQVQLAFGTSTPATQPYRPTSQLLRYQSLGPHRPADLINRGDSASMPLEPHAPIAPLGYSRESVQPQAPSYEPSLHANSPFDNEFLLRGNTLNGYGPMHNKYAPSASSYDSQPSSYEPPIDGYEPHADGYDPSSYQPYQPNTSEDDDNLPKEARKKQSAMDIDDGLATSKKRLKSTKDKEADDAFRKAAEADAARDSRDKGDKKGWFGGGWFGKKDPNAPTVHKAKLGEENSFVYDAETKRWINKKAGASQEAATIAAAPPPRGSLSRQVSSIGPVSSTVGGGAPPMKQLPLAAGLAPMSRSISAGLPPAGSTAMASVYGNGNEIPASLAGLVAGNASTASLPTSESAPSVEPPSRPATSMSGATDPMDELIGGAQARKGGTIKKGKKGSRYVDVMAK